MNTTELITRLKAAAEKASDGEWVKESGDGWEAACSANDQANSGFIIAHFEGPDAAANREFVQAANPVNVLALVEALKSAQKSNEFLKDQLSELANFNPDWDKLEASYESWREIAAELLAAKGRIAELEGRAIKFPPKVERDDSDGYWMLKGQRVSAANAAYYNEALKDVALALFAAGIKCEVKGE